jgi:rubrerythrin
MKSGAKTTKAASFPIFLLKRCKLNLKERTANNVHTAFVGEAKAYQRLLIFAKKAEEEDLPQIAHLFRAVAAAESVHSRRHFALLETTADTQTNLERAFQTETSVNGIYYPKMVQEAEEDGEETATLVFSQSRDAEAFHAKLYKKALKNLIAQRSTTYHVCTVCGYIAEGEPPQFCPICNAPSSKFEKIN